jgi:Domain of unknown function (DUF4384)
MIESEKEPMTSNTSNRNVIVLNIVARTLIALAFILILSGVHSAILACSPQGTPRKIVSDDFAKNRQEAAPATPKSKGSTGQASTGLPPKARQPSRIYRLASTPIKKRRPTSGLSVVAQLGITIWRLRPAETDDPAGRALIREKGKSSGWVPERVESETMFREGDRLRISVESPRAGYLYVVDRDLFSDGTTGGAMLIYPWSDVDNEMRPGRLVDIPDQEDDPSYFTARLTQPNQVGEFLTFIVTSTPLDLPISDKPFQVSNIQMSKWTKLWGGESERFEMEGGAGEAWTKQEQQASAKKGTRQLTRDDPAPQTIYRVSAGDDKAILVNLRLRYVK